DGVEANPPMPQTQVSGLHWVGDLAVSCTVEAREAKGQLVLELVEGGRRMQCRVDLADGQARLSISGDAFQRTGATPITRPGTYEILFANVDDQLRLWIDGRLVQFDGPTTYGPFDNTIPTQADLEPVGIAAVGADVGVSHVQVLRDLYYIAVESTDGFRGGLCDYRTPGVYLGVTCTPESVAAFLSDPSRWQEAFSERSMRAVEFPLGDDQFLMLGDNSAQSKDSRLWGYPEYYVDRELLVGKAMFIYWPHSWDEVSIFGKTIPFPFFPNFKRMEFVR
ncbi:MAG: hypothetical protein JW719_01825, partial [Pirellulales bacterium]|nr:hypothetical protein [Pirellulales bacterium]